MADKRIAALLDIPAKVRFLSCEPLLGPIDLNLSIDLAWQKSDGGGTMTCDFKSNLQRYQDIGTFGRKLGGLWVICGGESGAQARAMHPDWARSLRDQCANARVPFHFKQWGEFAPVNEGNILADTTERPKPWRMLRSDDIITGPDQLRRVGTVRAGRILDGKLHDAFPKGAV